MEVEKLRLIHEREILDSMRSEIRAPKPSQYTQESEWYIISAAWIRAWETFLNSFTMSFPPPTLHPGPIDSSDIIQSPDPEHTYVTYDGNPFNVLLKPKIVIKRDYYVASVAQWIYLAETYTVIDPSEIKRFGQSARNCRLYPKEIKLQILQLTETDVTTTDTFRFLLHTDLNTAETATQILKLRDNINMLQACRTEQDMILSSVPQEVLNISQTQEKDRFFRLEVVLRNCQMDPATTVGKAVRPNCVVVVRLAGSDGPPIYRNNVGTTVLMARVSGLSEVSAINEVSAVHEVSAGNVEEVAEQAETPAV